MVFCAAEDARKVQAAPAAVAHTIKELTTATFSSKRPERIVILVPTPVAYRPPPRPLPTPPASCGMRRAVPFIVRHGKLDRGETCKPIASFMCFSARTYIGIVSREGTFPESQGAACNGNGASIARYRRVVGVSVLKVRAEELDVIRGSHEQLAAIVGRKAANSWNRDGTASQIELFARQVDGASGKGNLYWPFFLGGKVSGTLWVVRRIESAQKLGRIVNQSCERSRLYQNPSLPTYLRQSRH